MRVFGITSSAPKPLWGQVGGACSEDAQIGRRAARVRSGRYRALSFLMVASLTWGSGCGTEERPADLPRDNRVSRTATDGAVTLTLSAAPSEAVVEQTVTVVVEAVAPSSAAVELYDYERRLRESVCRYDCRVIAADREGPRPAEGGKLAWVQRVQIAFLVPDEVELPEATAGFSVVGELADGGAGAGPVSRSMATEKLPLTIQPAASPPLSEEQLKEIKVLEPVELPWSWPRWLWLGPLLVVGALVALRVLLFLGGLIFPPLRRLWPWLRGKLNPARVYAVAPPVPADVWARRALARLLADDLPTKGLVQEFYYRISGIVRGYVERRYGLSAPEMTTEEFLAAAAQDRRFGEELTTELNRFLVACDLVKYARQAPHPREADDLIQVAEQFIDRTRVREPEEVPAETSMGTPQEAHA